MKTFKTILALLAFFAVMGPCVHAETYHDDKPVTEVYAADHTCCHSCSDVPCAKPKSLDQVSPNSSLGIPLRLAPEIIVFEYKIPFVVPTLRPPDALQLLQTIQLLI